jgi:hypothetical protein
MVKLSARKIKRAWTNANTVAGQTVFLEMKHPDLEQKKKADISNIGVVIEELIDHAVVPERKLSDSSVELFYDATKTYNLGELAEVRPPNSTVT